MNKVVGMKRVFGPRKVSNAPLPRIERTLKRYSEAAEQLQDVCRAYGREMSTLRSELRSASSIMRPLKSMRTALEEPPLWDSELTVHCKPEDANLISRNLAILEARSNHLSLLRERVEETCNEDLGSISRYCTHLAYLGDAVINEEEPLWARKNLKPIAFSGFVGGGTAFVLLYQTTRASTLALVGGAVMGIACASFKVLKSLNKRRNILGMLWEHERKAIWLSQGFDICYPVLSKAVNDALESCRKGVKDLAENLAPQDKNRMAEERADKISARPQAS
jgi:hypothetical protein